MQSLHIWKSLLILDATVRTRQGKHTCVHTHNLRGEKSIKNSKFFKKMNFQLNITAGPHSNESCSFPSWIQCSNGLHIVALGPEKAMETKKQILRP